MRRVTLPFSVNLNAFANRFFKICCNRCWSVKIAFEAPRRRSTENANPLALATGSKFFSTNSRTCAMRTRLFSISINPDSILDRSRISLISCSRSSPDAWIVWAYSTCFEVRFPSSFSANSPERMSKLLRGVLSSCDMLARNSDLYFDVKASCAAFSSSEARAFSISAFLRSTSLFWSNRRRAFSSSSSFVFCSSSC